MKARTVARPARVDLIELMRLFNFLSPDQPTVKVMTLSGQPHTKARARFGRGKAFSSEKQKAAELETGMLLRQAMKEPFEGTLLLVALFYRESNTIIDVDNMLKHVKDSAKGICWFDDSQVTAAFGCIELDRESPRTVLAIGPRPSTIDRVSHHAHRCAFCEKIFTPATLQVKHCSQWCASHARAYGEASCLWCETSFDRGSGAQKYCTPRCRQANELLNAKKRRKERRKR